MGSLSSSGLKGRIGKQWSQIKTQQSHIIKNNYSQQEFSLFTIPNTQFNNNKLYFTRQFSSLPKTPKIICLEKQKQHFLILVEKGSKTILEWLAENHCQLSILLKLKDVLSAIKGLQNKFGSFLITQKMVKISQNDNLLVWYNQRFESNLIQLPLSTNKQTIQNQQIMIHNIIQIFRKCINKDFNINSFITGTKSFTQFKSKVKIRIQQIQTTCNSNTSSIAQIISKRQKHSLTPRKKNNSIYQDKNYIFNSNKKIREIRNNDKDAQIFNENGENLVNSQKIYARQFCKNRNDEINFNMAKDINDYIQSTKDSIKRTQSLQNRKIRRQNLSKSPIKPNPSKYNIKSKSPIHKPFVRKQKTLSALDQKSSQNYSSSSEYSSSKASTQIYFKSQAYNQQQALNNLNSIDYSQKTQNKPKQKGIFLKKQNQYQLSEGFNKKQFSTRKLLSSRNTQYCTRNKFKSYNNQQKRNQQDLISKKQQDNIFIHQASTYKPNQSFNSFKTKETFGTYKATQSFSSYKAADSFSSKKNFSSKITSGTLKRTREFQQNFRQNMMMDRQTIKQQSDQTHKNSNNYSIEDSGTIKQEREQVEISKTLSQDFNNLFSGQDSMVGSNMQDSTRQKQFQKILFGNH